MSGLGAPPAGARPKGWAVIEGHRPLVAIVAASWHPAIMDSLVRGAEETLAHAGADSFTMRVPGSFELPIATMRALEGTKEGHVDAAVALGAVIRGQTPHFDFVAQAATDGLLRVSLDTGKPVGFGLLTCDHIDQAFERAGLRDPKENKGAEAALAALDTLVAVGILETLSLPTLR